MKGRADRPGRQLELPVGFRLSWQLVRAIHDGTGRAE